MKTSKLRGIYAITDTKLIPNNSILKRVKQAIIGGASIIQFRDKTKKDNEIFDIVKSLQILCTKYNRTFILNDRIELACSLKVDGVHIGKDDKSLIETRKIFDGIVGVSCYGDIKLAKEAQKNGADYVAFGAMFCSGTKKNATIISKDIIKTAKQSLKIPICLIGGINSTNISSLLSLKPDMIAVVNDIFKNNDVENNTKKLYQALLNHKYFKPNM